MFCSTTSLDQFREFLREWNRTNRLLYLATMAGCRRGVRIREILFLSKASLEIALIFTAICLKAPTTSGQTHPSYFLSIDCGGIQPNYTENDITWVTDNGTYMNIGKSIEQPSINISVDPLGYNQSLLSYRYFPAPGSPEARNKYCYELSIPTYPQSVPYLLRVGFYKNSSLLGATRPFEFIVSADATNWFTVTSGDESANTYLFEIQEGIFNPPLSVMNICLQPVVGEAFISSLELRLLDTNMYSYEGGTMQYLSTKYRYNMIGPTVLSPATVRYPDDLYDRIWTTIVGDPRIIGSIANQPDLSYEKDVFYVPPTVMQDAWLFPNDLDSGIYWQLYRDGSLVYMTPAESHSVVVYVENLNASVTQPYDMFIGLDFNAYNPQLTVSTNATIFVYPYYVVQGNSLVFSASSGSSLNNLPMNALEIYGQYSYNFSTTYSDDGLVIGDLKTAFSLNDWTGDPCTPVPSDWLSCNLSIPVLGNLHDPCITVNSSTSQPCAPKSDLRTKYYVTSLNISHRPTSNFSGINRATKLASLQKMSITNCGIDNLAFQVLVNYTSQPLNILDLSYNYLTGAVSPFENMPFFQTLQYLNLNHNALTTFPNTWRNTTQTLITLDMSYNQLQGNVAALDEWVAINSGSLRDIYMSNNKLGGTFSSDLYFSGLPNLLNANFDENFIDGTLNLSTWYDALQQANTNLSATNVTLQLFSFLNNNIADIVPSADEFDSTISNLIKDTNHSFHKKGVLLGGNPYCSDPTSYMHQYLCRSTIDDNIQRQNRKKHDVLIISISAGVVGLFLFCLVLVSLWKLWKQVYTLRKIQQALADRKVQPPFYNYSDLKSATRDFHPENKLGHGGFGIVYKALLTDETQLAIKKLFNSQRLQVLDEFLNEVVLITGIKHRNLVQLKGCCIKDKQRILIYEYVEKGNLAEALWGSMPHGGLNWAQRFKICVGVARGLSYLHEELLPSIIHRDIKPENILLDKNYNPKIADFGLARHISEEASQAYTQVAGTLGYFAPEYVMQGQLSEKIDVYSYGIVILNVVSGRKCIDPLRSPEEEFLKAWVMTLFKKGLLFDILQPELRKDCVMEEVTRAIKIGLLCVQYQPEMRPTMSQVVTMLLGSMDIEVVLDKFDNIHSNHDKLFSPIDMQYPTLQIIEEDSTIVPLLHLNGHSSFYSDGNSSNSRPAETELTSPR